MSICLSFYLSFCLCVRPSICLSVCLCVSFVRFLQAFISILRTTGDREYICDAVIFNSTHLLTPSECALKLKKSSSSQTKRVFVTIGKPVNELRQSLDFSQTRCGQEYQVDVSMFQSDAILGTLVRKGFALFRIEGQIQKDHCTCRVCLPTEYDRERLTTSSSCYVSGFVNNGN